MATPQPGGPPGNGHPTPRIPAAPAPLDETLPPSSPPSPAADFATLPPRPKGGAAAEQEPGAGMVAGSAEAARVVIPGYEVLGELGRGGMGVVYKARQAKLNRLVALKMILSGAHAGGEERQRFLREAEAVARLQHPNIVQIHEIGEADGYPFFSLEYCPGGSLEKKLNGTPQPPGQAAALVEALARAVQAAHEAGVVHRDLKPANVLLLADGTPKITDFGLAKKLDDAAGPTASGAIMGTPSYMAPEQAEGKKGIGPAADVYALGAVLYEVLAGRPPFRAATSLDTVLQVISEEPVPPSRLLPGLPRDLETVCLKCLHKDPAHRYGSAAELADDLRRFQQGEPIRARPVGRVERAWRWCRRNRAVAISLAAVAAALLLGTAVATHFAIQSAGNEARALQQSDRAEASARQAGDRERDARQALADLEVEKRQTTDLLYATRINLAHREWQAANLQRARQFLEDCPPALRGWEWDYLKGLFDGRSLVLNGHVGMVLGVALTPDGSRAVTFGADKTVRVWDAHSGAELARFDEQAHLLALGPDGRRAAVAVGQGVKIFDVATGRELIAVPLSDIACGLGFVRDGKELGVALLDGEVRFLDAASGAERSRLGRRLTLDSASRQLLNVGQGVAFSPDGRRLAQGGGDCKVRVWDAATGERLLEAADHLHLRMVGQVAFSPDGRRLASPGGEGDVRVRDLDGKQPVQVLRGNGVQLLAVAFSPDGRRLAAASKDMTVRVWDAETGEALQTLRGHAASVMGVAFGGEGRVASAGADGTARIWEGGERVLYAEHVGALFRKQRVPDPARRGSQEALTIRGNPTPVSSLAFSPDGRLAATASLVDDAAHQVTVWELTGRRELHRLAVTRNRLYRLAFSPDGQRLAVGSGGGGSNDPAELDVFEVATGQRAWHWTGPLCLEIHPAFAPDGSRLAATVAAAQGDNFLVSWQADDGHEVFRQPVSGVHLRASYSPDGQTLVTAAAAAGQVELYDAGTGRPLRTWAASAGALTDVVCGPRGLVATADARAVIKLWDLADGRERAALEGHAGLVLSLAFSPDGQRLLSGGNDLTARLWHTGSGRELLTFRELSDIVQAVAWSPDGSRVGAATGDGIVKIWTAPAAATLPRTDDWPVVSRDDFAADGPPGRWKPANESPWEVRGGALHGRQVNTTYSGSTFPVAVAGLSGAELPRTAEVRFAYRADRPLVMGVTLGEANGQRAYSVLLCGGPKPFGAPCARLQQITEGLKISYVGVERPFRAEPSRWQRVRLLREPERIRVYVDDVELLSERIPDVDLSHLALQGSFGAVGDGIEFKEVEVRAPADAVREQALRGRARALFDQVLLRDEVRRRLEAEGGLTPADRPLVERLTAELTEDPDRLEKASREASNRPTGRAEDYELARKQAEVALRAAPDNPLYLGTLARAQYRTGRFAEAVATVRQSLEGTRAEHGAGYPYQYGILAKAHHRLGQDDAAREELGHVRDLLLSDSWSGRPLARAALADTEAVLGDVAKPDGADEAAIKRLVTRSELDGWLRHDLAGFLAAYADDARIRTGRGEEPGPHDVTLDRRQLEEVRRLDFQGVVLRTDIVFAYEDMRVRVRGDEAELRCRSSVEFGTSGYQVFGLVCRLQRGPQGWRIHEYRSWPLAERQGSRRTVKDAAAWAALDAAVERLAKSSDLTARIQALRDASRPAEAYDLARRLTEEKGEDAAAWVLRGDLAHDVGRAADARASFRQALTRDPDAELPWYMTRLRLAFRGHDGTVLGVAWHPDGKRLFSAGTDKVGRLWEAATGREVRQFTGSADILHNAALSPDGRLAAAGSTVATVWDVESGRPRAECRGHGGVIYRLAFSPDGSRLVTASADHTARVWDAATGRELLVLRGHTDDVLGAAFSPDGKLIATASHDRTAKLWDAGTGAEVRTFQGHTDVLKRVVFSPDGRLLATTGGDRTVRLWDVSTGREVRQWRGDDQLIEVVLFSPDGRLLATADVGGRVRLWDAGTGAKRWLLRGHEGAVFALAFRPDGQALASAGRDGVFLWDLAPEETAPDDKEGP